MKFIRFAESKIQHQGSGIFAFISNNSFLDNPTFRGMRYHLLQSFDRIYILDLHGNTRKKETTPSGDKDDNVFDIMQGVSINIFIKTTQDSKDLAKLYHAELYGKRKEKYNFLYQHTLDSIEWKELDPQEPFYLFIPQDESLKAEYDKGWSVKDIFKVSGVGITTAHDNFVIDSSKERLLQKFESFRDSAPNADELHLKFSVAKKQGWDILQGWKNLQNQDDLSKYIQKISYRPFDTRYIFYENKLVWRCVKDIMQHFLHDFDNDMWIENFTQEFRDFIDSKYKEHFSPEQILGYIYAVLFHKDYREKYLDFLKIDFPKIPFVESKEKFLALSDLGLELLNTHLMADITERENRK